MRARLAISRLARDWMLGRVKDEAMPSLIKKWLRRVIIWVGAAKEIADSLRRGRALMDADQRGELDRKFMGLVADMAGLNEEARAARAQADSEAAIMAEAMGGYDEIGDWAKGKLMFPKEAREAGDDLAGELERVYDGLTSEKASKAKMVDGKWVESKSKRVTAKANKYFVKGGMSPADLFELAQEAGFEFENTGDMLSALYDSVAHGIKHYNMGSVDVGLSYSLAAADEVEGQRVADAWHKVEAMGAVVSDHPEVYDMERSKAVAYARERYRLLQQKFQRDGFIVEVDGGKKVGVTRKGFMEVKNHIADRRNLSALASLDNILKNAKYLHSADNTDKGRKPDIVQFHYYMTKVSFPGYSKYKDEVGEGVGGMNIEEAYVLSVVSEDKAGNLFYDIALQSIEDVNKIRETSKSLPRLRVSNSAQIGDASLKTRLEYLQAFVNYIDEKNKNDDKNDDMVSFSIAPQEEQQWKSSLNDYLSKGAADRAMPIKMSSVPNVLQALGFYNRDVVITPSTLDKVMGGKHNLDQSHVERLAAAIHDPLMIVDSATQAESIVILTEVKTAEGNVIAAIQLDKLARGGFSHVVASAYDGVSPWMIINQIKAGKLRYIDKKRALSWTRENRLQLPALSFKKGKPSVLTPEDVVKWKNAQDGKSFSLGPVEDGKSTPLNDGTVWAALSNAMERGARKKVEILKVAQDRLKAELDAAGMNEDGTLKFADWKKSARLKSAGSFVTAGVRRWFGDNGLDVPNKIDHLLKEVDNGNVDGGVKKLVRVLKSNYAISEELDKRLAKGGFDVDGGVKSLLKGMGNEFTRDAALRLVGVMDSVVGSLPKIVQDRLWSENLSLLRNNVLNAKTLKGQQGALKRLAYQVGEAVEGALKVSQLDEIERLLKWSEEREGENRVKRGKLMVDIQREIRSIRSVMSLSQKHLEEERTDVENALSRLSEGDAGFYDLHASMGCVWW